jgi:hypothetical protein
MILPDDKWCCGCPTARHPDVDAAMDCLVKTSGEPPPYVSSAIAGYKRPYAIHPVHPLMPFFWHSFTVRDAGGLILAATTDQRFAELLVSALELKSAPGWTCSACGCFVGELKERRSACRCCGLARR